ncbi:MAG: cadherin-like beta sandwich domain-containing protein [Clostridia bacterium]|nr:cadherin-like beta sandwich domain-containing protein [Clostridia bacterium]
MKGKALSKPVKVLACMVMTLLLTMISGKDTLPGLLSMDSVMAAGDFMYFPYPVYTVSEDCQVADILLMRKRTSLWLITADYTTADVTAAAGSDYIAIQGTKTMTMFLQDSLSVTIANDILGEADEEFTITLSGQYTLDDPANGYYKSCTVVITDDDGGVSLSDNNFLDSLEISSGSLSPMFSESIQAYEADFGDTVQQINIRACPEDGAAMMELNGIPLLAGVWSNSITLEPGQNTAELLVEAENGDPRIYVITFNRDILPVLGLYTSPLTAGNGNLLSVDNNIEYSDIHAVVVQDDSTTGWGWRLWLFLDEYMESGPGLIDDPLLMGSEWLDVRIPSAALCSFSLLSITKPDQVNYSQGYSLDIAGAPVISGIYKTEALTDTSGIPGLYIVYIGQNVSIPSWLPEGTIISSSSGSSGTIIGSADMKQTYGSNYYYEINYTLERIIQP